MEVYLYLPLALGCGAICKGVVARHIIEGNVIGIAALCPS